MRSVFAAIAGEPVEAHLVHHEPTIDERDEVRRHVTVLVLTPSRLILAHTDEHAPDDVLPAPYTSTTTEAITLHAVRTVVPLASLAAIDEQPLGQRSELADELVGAGGAESTTSQAARGRGAEVLRRPVRGADRRGHGDQQGRGQSPRFPGQRHPPSTAAS